MDEGLAAIFAAITANELASIAAAVLGTAQAQAGPAEFAEITTPHADPRTIGIVRVSGVATVEGLARRWSCVTKVVDLLVPNTLGTTVDPRIEVAVYEKGHFASAGLPLRPARCHHISRPRPGLTILWLEDLTDAKGPPFSPEELSEMAAHLGKWNAATAADPPLLDFPIGRDYQASSSAGFDFPARVRALHDLRDEPVFRAMYPDGELDVAAGYVSAFGRLIERSKTLPHAVSLADCPVSNFFHLPGETIAIDWAGVGNEPVGADGGRFIGSAMTWGREFAVIAARERELFESYLGGLREGGATTDRRLVRSGYLSQAGFYLGTIVTQPTLVMGRLAKFPQSFFEKRYGLSMAEFGAAAAGVIARLPSYTTEIDDLLA